MNFIQWYLIIGFVLEFKDLVLITARKPEKRPKTILEVLIVAIVFSTVVPFWPLRFIYRFTT